MTKPQAPADGVPIWLTAFSIVTLLFFGGAFSVVFGNLNNGKSNVVLDSGGPAFAALTILLQGAAIIFLLRLRNGTYLFLGSFWRTAVLVLAAFSVFWSQEPADTLRRVVALFGTTAVGVYLAGALDERAIRQHLAIVLGIIALASMGLALFFPAIGTHRELHMGSWRGVFQMKNGLGWAMAMALLALWAAYRERLLPSAYLVPLLAVAMLCLLKAGSATGILGAFAGVAALLYVSLIRGAGRYRHVVLMTFASFIGVAVVAQQVVFPVVLQALGRSENLTGRTAIWNALRPAIENRPILGYGYDAFWRSEVAFDYMRAAFFAGHAHNGYLDVMLGLGVIGLGMVVLYLLGVLLDLHRLSVVERDPTATLLFAMLVSILVMGFSGPLVMRPNGLYWVLISLAGAYSLRARLKVTAARSCAAGTRKPDGSRWSHARA